MSAHRFLLSEPEPYKLPSVGEHQLLAHDKIRDRTDSKHLEIWQSDFMFANLILNNKGFVICRLLFLSFFQ